MSKDTEESSKKHAWCRANEAQINQYRSDLDKELSKIKLPSFMNSCIF